MSYRENGWADGRTDIHDERKKCSTEHLIKTGTIHNTQYDIITNRLRIIIQNSNSKLLKQLKANHLPNTNTKNCLFDFSQFLFSMSVGDSLQNVL